MSCSRVLRRINHNLYACIVFLVALPYNKNKIMIQRRFLMQPIDGVALRKLGVRYFEKYKEMTEQ